MDRDQSPANFDGRYQALVIEINLPNADFFGWQTQHKVTLPLIRELSSGGKHGATNDAVVFGRCLSDHERNTGILPFGMTFPLWFVPSSMSMRNRTQPHLHHCGCQQSLLLDHRSSTCCWLSKWDNDRYCDQPVDAILCYFLTLPLILSALLAFPGPETAGTELWELVLLTEL